MKKNNLPNHLTVKVPLGFLKHKWFLGIIVATIVLVISLYWAIGTPQYSMWQLKQAVIHQDVDKTMRFINVDKLMDNVWPKFTSTIMAEATKIEDPFEMMGAMFGSGLIENMKPMIKDQLITSIKDGIAGKSDSDEQGERNDFVFSKEDLNKLKLKTDQDKIYILIPAELTDAEELRLILTRAQDGRYWQITDLDIDWGKILDSTQ